MKSALSRVCLVVLGVIIGPGASSEAASARRGDLVYLEQALRGNTADTWILRAKSPMGVVRGSLRLGADEYNFHNIGVSSDGNLTFLMRDRLYLGPEESDVWVVAIRNGNPKVLSKHVLAPYLINALAGCSTAGPAAIAAGSPAGGMYPIFLGLACSRGCSPKTDDNNNPLFSATWVLQLSYDVRTRSFTKIGATRTSVVESCKRDVINQVRALYVPRLPGGKNGAPLMVFGEHDTPTFRFRGVKPGSPNLLSWRAAPTSDCSRFVIAGPSEFYSFCPDRLTNYEGPGAIKQIKRTPKGQRLVTNVGGAPAALGRGQFITGLAALEGASQPFYAATDVDELDGKGFILRHSKSNLRANGEVALRVTAGSAAFLLAVVP